MVGVIRAEGKRAGEMSQKALGTMEVFGLHATAMGKL